MNDINNPTTGETIRLGKAVLDALGLDAERPIINVEINLMPLALPQVTVTILKTDENDKVIIAEDGRTLEYEIQRFTVVDIIPLLNSLEMVEVKSE